MKYYFFKDQEGQYLIPRQDQARICRIVDSDIEWEIVEGKVYYQLTGTVIDVEEDQTLLLSETTTDGVYIPVIDGESDWIITKISESVNNTKTIKNSIAVVALAVMSILIFKNIQE